MRVIFITLVILTTEYISVMKKTALLLVFLVQTLVSAQSTFPFDVVLTPITISGLPGIQSYAAGEHNGKWLIIGGRLDGLHQRQPWQAFDANGHNTYMYVIDPVAKTYTQAPLSGFANDSVEAQLSSTNANFHQIGNLLYIAGGYGLSSTSVHITHPRLTVIDVPAMITAITANGTVDTTAYQSVQDSAFAVTGGKLLELDGTFYLVGGHRFDGQYNPMGHNTYVQSYTEAVRPFTVNGTFPNLSHTFDSFMIDTDELHRRDYNVTYMTDGSETYITAWSGVFQKTANLPFLNPVEVRDTGIAPIAGFSQYLNHYHCPTASLFGENKSAMYTLFFGGIAQYYYANGTLTQDNDVPFVTTIGLVEKRNGNYTEAEMSTEMPGYYGAGAEFFPSSVLAQTGAIFLADSIGADTTQIGHLFGGIKSPAQNVFFGGMTNASVATANIYEVALVRNSGLSVTTHDPNDRRLAIQVQPNPTSEKLVVQLNSPSAVDTHFEILSTSGQLMYSTSVPSKLGKNTMDLGQLNLSSGTYVLTATQAGGFQQRISFIWK